MKKQIINQIERLLDPVRGPYLPYNLTIQKQKLRVLNVLLTKEEVQALRDRGVKVKRAKLQPPLIVIPKWRTCPGKNVLTIPILRSDK